MSRLPPGPGGTALRIALWVLAVLVLLVVLFFLFEYVAPHILPNQY